MLIMSNRNPLILIAALLLLCPVSARPSEFSFPLTWNGRALIYRYSRPTRSSP